MQHHCCRRQRRSTSIFRLTPSSPRSAARHPGSSCRISSCAGPPSSRATADRCVGVFRFILTFPFPSHALSQTSTAKRKTPLSSLFSGLPRLRRPRRTLPGAEDRPAELPTGVVRVAQGRGEGRERTNGVVTEREALLGAAVVPLLVAPLVVSFFFFVFFFFFFFFSEQARKKDVVVIISTTSVRGATPYLWPFCCRSLASEPSIFVVFVLSPRRSLFRLRVAELRPFSTRSTRPWNPLIRPRADVIVFGDVSCLRGGSRLCRGVGARRPLCRRSRGAQQARPRSDSGSDGVRVFHSGSTALWALGAHALGAPLRESLGGLLLLFPGRRSGGCVLV